MNVSKVNYNTGLSFKRALTSNEEKDFKRVTKEAEKVLNTDNGIHIFKIFQYALPSKDDENLGIGKLNSEEAMKYLQFMALYTGSNAVKIYPSGQMPTRMRFPNYYCPYERHALAIGEDNINFFKLTQKNYGELLNKEDIEKYTVENTARVNYENELDNNTGADFKLIQKAYNNMQIKNTDESNKIKAEFEEYKNSLTSDTFDRLAIAPFVSKNDNDLFNNIENVPAKQNRYAFYQKKYKNEIDIYKFGKFLATKNLQEAKEELNAKGLELYGDCPIGFTKDEVFAHPDAFYPPNITPGWKFRAIKYEDIPKEGTPANKLFKEKIAWHLKAFDGIRFDVGWQYFSLKLKNYDENGNFTYYPIDEKDNIVKFIEKTAKEIKGEDFNTKKLMYEADAGADDFQMFDWTETDKPITKEYMKNRTAVVTSLYEHGYGYGWANPKFYEKAGLNNYILGTNNHDSTPLRALAENENDKTGTYNLYLPDIRETNKTSLVENLNINYDWLKNSKNFIKAKFAEIQLAKNHFVFFNDVTSSSKRMDNSDSNPEDYRIRITNNYEKEYHKTLQEGYGFNLAESLRLAMESKSLDKTNPKLYSEVVKYANILYEQGATTKEESDATM